MQWAYNPRHITASNTASAIEPQTNLRPDTAGSRIALDCLMEMWKCSREKVLFVRYLYLTGRIKP